MKNLLLIPSQRFDIPPLSKPPIESNLKLPNLFTLPPSSLLQNIFNQSHQTFPTLLPPPSQKSIFPIPKFSIPIPSLAKIETSIPNYHDFSFHSLNELSERIKQEVKYEEGIPIIKKEEQVINCKLEEEKDVKQEYQEENTNFSSLINKKINKDKVAKEYKYKKSTQNRIKNLPGLIIQRVRSSIKLYLNLKNPAEHGGFSRIQYVEMFLKDLNRMEKDRFMIFLEQYEKRWKTWNSILTFLSKDQEYGLIILDIIAKFLSDSGKEDFEEWLRSGKMCEKSKATILETKDLLAYKFSQIFKNPGVLQESFSGTRLLKKQKTDLQQIEKHSESIDS